MRSIRFVPHPRLISRNHLVAMAAALEARLGRALDPSDLVVAVKQTWRPISQASAFETWTHPRRPPRRPLWREEEREKVRAFDRTCTYCLGRGTALLGPDRRPWDYDHYVPKARGGSCQRINYVLACERCNNLKVDELWLPGTTTDFTVARLFDEQAWFPKVMLA